MKKIITILLTLFICATATAQITNTIVIDRSSFRAVQTDALTGANVDPIGIDHSRRACARLKIFFHKMTREQLAQLDAIFPSGTIEKTKIKVADYENVLILEMTAKPQVAFYLKHPTFGTSNEVTLSLEGNKEYQLEATLNQTFSIVVESNVVGADVYIDGVFKGQTGDSMKCTISDVMIGGHSLKVVYGKVSGEKNIDVNKNSIFFTQNIDQNVTEVNTYKVGDYYNENGKEGVVFEVSADGKHGKIVSMKQSSEKLQWASNIKEQKRLIAANRSTDGAVNMARVKAISGWQDKYPAFKWCADLGEGWYLPSKEELRTIYKYKDKLNPNLTDELSDGLFWSSTEYNYKYIDGKSCAWYVLVGSGSTCSTQKFNTGYVRAVSAFGDSSKSKLDETIVSNHTTSAPYKVGDYYNENGKQGVVFEVSADGCHGKIVSIMQSGILQWSSDGKESRRLIGANSTIDGAYNMAQVKAVSGWRDKYPAFKWCADLGEGWYLPSKEELRTIYNNKNEFNLHLTDELSGYFYWSSTECNHQYLDGVYCAWLVNFMDNGGTHGETKSYYRHVRAVSAFGDSSKIESAATTVSNRKTSAPYKVGDYYNDGVKEGVVFEVSEDGRHGKIVSMKQSAGELRWSSDSAEQNRLIGANSETDGAYNMVKVKAISGWQSKYPAFKWCADLGEGWYLPSKEELKVFTLNTAIYDAVNRTLIARGGTKLYDKDEGGWYWSSTESDKQFLGYFCAWLVYMLKGSTYYGSKSYSGCVRAVSAFY